MNPATYCDSQDLADTFTTPLELLLVLISFLLGESGVLIHRAYWGSPCSYWFLIVEMLSIFQLPFVTIAWYRFTCFFLCIAFRLDLCNDLSFSYN